MRLRLQGVKQSIHQWHFERGDLFVGAVGEEFDPELKRYVRSATLKRNGKDVFPPLRDVAIVTCPR